MSVVALIETVWALRSYYDASRPQIQRVIEPLLRTRGVRVERSDLVWTALGAYSRGNADFGDYLIVRHGHAAGCEFTLTFDRDASHTAGIQLPRLIHLEGRSPRLWLLFLHITPTWVSACVFCFART